MYSKLSRSLEKIPRSRGCLCLSLKFGCILTALIFIVYSTLGLAVGVAKLVDLEPPASDQIYTIVATCIDLASNAVSFLLSFVLLLGLLKERSDLVQPWILWTTFQTLAFASIFIVFNTVQILNHDDTPFVVYFIGFAILAVRLYMLVIVTSFYKQMKEDEEDRQFVKELMSKENWYTDM